MSAPSDGSAQSVVGSLIDAIGAARALSLLELALLLRLELVAKRGAQLHLEPLDGSSGYDARLIWDGDSPRQDLQLAFGLAWYLRTIGCEEPLLDLAIAWLRTCDLREAELLSV